MAELAVSPADRGLRRSKTLTALRYKAVCTMGALKQKVTMEIPDVILIQFWGTTNEHATKC
jgi:hypothetical protein